MVNKILLTALYTILGIAVLSLVFSILYLITGQHERSMFWMFMFLATGASFAFLEGLNNRLDCTIYTKHVPPVDRRRNGRAAARWIQ